MRILLVIYTVINAFLKSILASKLVLKPNLFTLNVNQTLGMPFEPQRFDVSVFDVFFGFGFLEGSVQAH